MVLATAFESLSGLPNMQLATVTVEAAKFGSAAFVLVLCITSMSVT